MAEARIIGSLPVANVQVLAEACNGAGGVDGDQRVPERYLSKDPATEEVVVAGDDDPACAIPVIDLHKLQDPETEEECAKLGSACLNWGFVPQLGLLPAHQPWSARGSDREPDQVEFFEQPLEGKKECAQQPGSLEGYGQAFVVSEDQMLDWADMLYVQVHPTESRDPRFWPTRPASFRRSVDVYSSEARELAYMLLEFMAKAAGAEPASLRGVFEGQTQGMRVNYYPPCRQAADRVLGLTPHTDACGLTLLLQASDEDVQGLQVKKDGRWFAVQAVDGAFIVNVGDVLEIMSNGKFTSVEHRAVIHPTKERISVALFHYPCQNMVVGPLEEVVRGDEVRYRSTNYQEFLKQYFTAKLDGRKHLERLKLEE